jgi:hypothetical protein
MAARPAADLTSHPPAIALPRDALSPILNSAIWLTKVNAHSLAFDKLLILRASDPAIPTRLRNNC